MAITARAMASDFQPAAALMTIAASAVAPVSQLGMRRVRTSKQAAVKTGYERQPNRQRHKKVDGLRGAVQIVARDPQSWVGVVFRSSERRC